MRPLEWVLTLGAAVLVIGWAARRRPLRWLGFGLPVVLLAHLALEGQRFPMWPSYLLVALGVVGAVRRGAPATARGRWRTALRWSGAVVVLALLLPLPWLWPVIRLPTPSGPYPIGTSWLVVADSGRPERFKGHGQPREFPVKVWYPAAAQTGPETPYVNDPREVGFGALPPMVFRQLALVRTHSTVGPSLASGDRFPPLVFSHGYGGFAGQNTPQMEELASQGYVVFSIVHPGEASWTPFPDRAGMPMDSALLAAQMAQATDTTLLPRMMAELARLDSASNPAERVARFREFLDLTPEPLRSESIQEWTADTRNLVDLLERLDRGELLSPFAGRLDLDRLGVFGMSYGGATVGEFCRADPRCRAGINIDGGQYGGLVDDSLTIPYLIIASQQAASVHPPVLDLIRGPAYMVTVPETTHLGLTDLTLMGPLLRWAGVTGRLDPGRRERIMTAYVLGFFETYLRDRPSPLFSGRSTEFPDVALVRRNVP